MSAFGELATSRLARTGLGFLLLAFCAAPVPGDAGGCGQRAQELDPGRFFVTKARIDCDRCEECGIESAACERACRLELLETEFGDGCVPLVHDGEVCLRALLVASCEDFSGFVSDTEATAPTECAFCPRGAP